MKSISYFIPSCYAWSEICKPFEYLIYLLIIWHGWFLVLTLNGNLPRLVSKRVEHRFTYPEESNWSLSAPQASSIRTQSTEPPRAAIWSGVLPGKLQKVPRSIQTEKSTNIHLRQTNITSNIITYPYPPVEAHTRAPLSNREWRHSCRLWRAARCRGVAPFPSLMFTNLANPLTIP